MLVGKFKAWHPWRATSVVLLPCLVDTAKPCQQQCRGTRVRRPLRAEECHVPRVLWHAHRTRLIDTRRSGMGCLHRSGSACPPQDSPGAKMSYEAVVRVPQPLTALMSAVPREEPSADGEGPTRADAERVGPCCACA